MAKKDKAAKAGGATKAAKLPKRIGGINDDFPFLLGHDADHHGDPEDHRDCHQSHHESLRHTSTPVTSSPM